MDDDIGYGSPKDYNEQTDAFRWDLDNLIDRYLSEFDINTFVMIGALQEKVQELIEDGNSSMDIPLDEDLWVIAKKINVAPSLNPLQKKSPNLKTVKGIPHVIFLPSFGKTTIP